jgi:hypothetical protein
MRGPLLTVHGGALRHIGPEAFAKCGCVVGINVCVLGRPRNGDVGKARVEQFGRRVRVHVHDDAVFG